MRGTRAPNLNVWTSNYCTYLDSDSGVARACGTWWYPWFAQQTEITHQFFLRRVHSSLCSRDDDRLTFNLYLWSIAATKELPLKLLQIHWGRRIRVYTSWSTGDAQPHLLKLHQHLVQHLVRFSGNFTYLAVHLCICWPWPAATKDLRSPT